MRDWWDLKTKQNFHERTDCIADYWGNKPWDIQGVNITINGNLTLDENIADLGAIVQSYEAYGVNNFECIFFVF